MMPLELDFFLFSYLYPFPTNGYYDDVIYENKPNKFPTSGMNGLLYVLTTNLDHRNWEFDFVKTFLDNVICGLTKTNPMIQN